MASIDLGPFGEHWFQLPPNPFAALGFLSPNYSPSRSSSSVSLPFCSISISKLFAKKPDKPDPETPGTYKKMLEQYYWECENLPDYRKDPEVERLLQQDPVFEKKENPTPEEVEENKKMWEEIRSSPVLQFLAKVERIEDKLNEKQLSINSEPYRKEDRDLWQALPHVPGLDGRPMPRKAIKTKRRSNDKFWDFMKQFLFGLWGFRQRPYPPGRPIDITQVLGYKRLENRYYDFAMKTHGWFYKDRLGRTRGPCELVQLKTAWGGGIIDTHTFIWGEDMDEWAPIGMVYGLERAIATWDARLGASATALLHKLQKGLPPWAPLKGHESKTYKQLQEEAIESKKRDLAVLKANDGIWPGVRIPSHALFLWASGSELTTILDQDHMPNKYIPKNLRRTLVKLIPGLRPCEVLSIEQAMDQITFGGAWYREPIGSYMTGPPYIQEFNSDIKDVIRALAEKADELMDSREVFVPFWDKVMKRVDERLPMLRARWRNKLRRKKQDKENKYWFFRYHPLDVNHCLFDMPRGISKRNNKKDNR